jgi:predicted O-linked N-acetylglucosamine transferase (SPINDLY family)
MQVTLDRALELALGHVQAGRWAEAEGVYRQVLAAIPEHPDALHMLGILACQRGAYDAAIDLIGRAIARNPGIAEYHSNLGESYRRAGQADRALDCFRRAVAFKPGLAEAHNSLGILLEARGRREEAIAAYRRALALKPGLAEAHNNLGICLHAQGQFDEALASYRRALAIQPDYPEAHNNLGMTLHSLKRFDEALAAHARAAQLRPEYAEAHMNLGLNYYETGRREEAIAAYRRALQLRPDLAVAYNNLGIALHDTGRLDEAIAVYLRAIQLKPDYADVRSNLGNVLWDQGRLDEAGAAYRQSLELKPDAPYACNNLGNVFKDQGRLDEALAHFRKAVDLKPDYTSAASNFVFTAMYHPAHDAAALLAEHRRWARQFADPLAGQIRPHANDRDPDRRIRVGFLSPDLRDHPVGQSLLPLFIHRDRGRTEVVCYCDARRPDAFTARLQGLADLWRDTLGQTDEQVADLIRADRVDLLVDTTLHSGNHRLLVFARKPAPVQAVMLGLPLTTGLSAVDYRLTDAYLDPPGLTDGDYVERSIRLPHAFWCYRPPEHAPAVGPLPAGRNGSLTFGSLNRFAKVTPQALELWLRLLQALPASRLVIYSQPGSHRDDVRARFEAGDIAADRLTFIAKVAPAENLPRYHELDLCLDPFPHNGHISTLDSLWMGVPVLTLAGSTVVGRAGVSLLSNVGLPEFIARTPDQLIEIATRWAGDLPGLAAVRAGLRPRMEASPLLDYPQFTADVEAVFRQIWTTWCRQ